MKKVLIICLLAFLLTGCTKEANVQLSSGDEVIYSSEKTTYTKKDLFEQMRTQDYTSVVLSKILNVISEKEGINSEEIDAELEEEYKMYVAYGYESYITYYYGSKENFISYLKQNTLASKLMELKAKEDMNDYAEQYKPYKAQVVYFDNQDSAKNVVSAVKNLENTFEYAVLENGYEDDCSATIYTDSSDLPLEVKELILNTNEIGVTDVVISSTVATDSEGNSTVTPRYYVVNIVSKDVKDFEDDFVSYIAENYLDSAVVINDYIVKYNVTVHDQRTYELLSTAYPGVKY